MKDDRILVERVQDWAFAAFLILVSSTIAGFLILILVHVIGLCHA